ncbi:MAG: UDP-N-acetylmuramate dehydrogenase [Dehalococcoidia bacterium]|nr:UDP-N-acetylmuramate dehydrogenase [Dehalococcoidia bacterium]
MLPTNILDHLTKIAHVRENEPLSHHVTIRVGGTAAGYVVARDLQGLKEIMRVVYDNRLDFIVIGAGSNLLFRDGGFSGLVIENFNVKGGAGDSSVQLEENADGSCLVKVESGIPLARLSYYLSRNGFSGLEWAVGIPGTIGGAVVNNAGAHGGSIGNILEAAYILEPGDVLKQVTPADLEYSYRYSNIRYKWRENGYRPVVLQVTLRLHRESPDVLQKRIMLYSGRRRSSQPSQPSSGSMFKNPLSHTAGWLIDQAGLKGTRIGDAQISSRHGNFFVNRGHASYSDVEQLMNMAKDKVLQGFDIALEEEVEILGNDASE